MEVLHSLISPEGFLQCNINPRLIVGAALPELRVRSPVHTRYSADSDLAAANGPVSSLRAARPGEGLSPVAVALITFALSVGSFGIGTGEFAIMGLLPELAR